jgi:hypothetical protein
MRAHEFLTEAEKSLDPVYQASLNGAMTFPSMDQYYEMYRFSVLTASSDASGGFAVDATNVLRDHPMTAAYSEAEQEMIKQSAKKLGKEVKELTRPGTSEPDDTHKESPVAGRKEIWDLYK